MKKRKIFISALMLFLIIPLMFNIKTNAAVNQYQDIIIDFETTLQYYIVFTPPKNHDMASGTTYPLLTTTYSDPDSQNARSYLLQYRLTSYDNTYQLGQNGTPFSPNLYIDSTKLYGLHIYPYMNTTYIALYSINSNYNSQSGEITFTINQNIKTIEAPYNLNGGDAASNIKYYFYGNLISSYYENYVAAWDTTYMNIILNDYFNYELFNYELINGYDTGYSDGYDRGYELGYVSGENTITPLNKVWNIIGGIFQVVANVMAIELFPHIPLGTFFLIPLIFGAIGFIFWIWKRGS